MLSPFHTFPNCHMPRSPPYCLPQGRERGVYDVFLKVRFWLSVNIGLPCWVSLANMKSGKMALFILTAATCWAKNVFTYLSMHLLTLVWLSVYFRNLKFILSKASADRSSRERDFDLAKCIKPTALQVLSLASPQGMKPWWAIQEKWGMRRLAKIF